MGGGRLFVGGLEAAEGVCRGFVPMNIMVECRGGDSQHWDRDRSEHNLPPPPPEVQKVYHAATRYTQRLNIDGLRSSLVWIMQQLADGASVLCYCLNGKNRSAQTATFIVAAALADWPRAKAHVYLRRTLVDYSSLRGRPLEGPLVSTSKTKASSAVKY